MKRLFIVSMIFVFTVISSSAIAQMKVALVDIQRCLYESDAGKKVQQELRKIMTERDAQLKIARDEIAKMEKDFIDQEKILSDTAKKDRAEKIQNRMIEFEDTARKFNTEIQRKEREATEKMEPELKAVISTVAKGDKIDIVFFSQAVLYAPNAVDITQKVIDLYNKQQSK